MTDPNRPAASLAGVSLTLGDWLVSLRRRGRLMPLLREAVIECLLLDRASQTGLAVSPEELQRAADVFRLRQGLNSAEQTHTWLAEQRLSAQDFEDALEHDLLIAKLKDHLTRDRIAEHFATHRDGYAGARLRLILVAREDLACELLTQIRDEGREFADVAREHSQHSSRSDGGRLSQVLRRQLPAAIGDALFAAGEGALVGPLATPQGFHLFLIEKLLPAELDADLTARIREELFDTWLRDHLSGQQLELPLLEVL